MKTQLPQDDTAKRKSTNATAALRNKEVTASARQAFAHRQRLPYRKTAMRRPFRKGWATLKIEVHSLPESYRDALILTALEGLTQKEFAERKGISLSGAKSRVQRGREQLNEMLHKCCTFEFDRRGRVIDCTPRIDSDCKEARGTP